MVTHDAPEVLVGFLVSAQPAIEYTVLADPEHASGIGDDSLALVVDGGNVVRWLARWHDHRNRPGYQTILRAIREVTSRENSDETIWSCPIPPKENRLTIRIESGEKKFKEDNE